MHRIASIGLALGILVWLSMLIGWSMLFCMYPVNAVAKQVINLPVYLEPPRPLGPPSPPTNLRIVDDISSTEFERFRWLLNHGGPEERVTAAKELYAYEHLDSYFIPLLSEQLKSDDPIVRRAVAGALARFGPAAYPAITPLIGAIEDVDGLTRLNALVALGGIGENAGFATDRIIRQLHSEDPLTRQYAVVALANIGPSASAAIPDIQKLLMDDKYRIREYAIIALGRVGPKAFITIPDLVNLWKRPTSSSNEKTSIAETVAEIAKSVQDADAVESLPLIEQAKVLLENSRFRSTIEESLKTVERASKYLKLREQGLGKPNDRQVKIVFEDAVPEGLIGQSLVAINGVNIPITDIKQGEHSIFLGTSATDIVNKGLNILEVGKTRLYYWREHIKLQSFKNPYKRSYAIIVAINDYNRKKKDNGLGPTGLPPLSSMVSGGRELASTLEKLGFPKANIFEFYDTNATSENLDKILKEFWAGAKYEKADRLFFYFGGHGAVNGNSAYLVTYDYEPKRPTLTSFLMEDLTSRHFANLKVHHVLVALDACLSGLALPKHLSLDDDKERIKGFRTLSLIENDTRDDARNLIVAATGEQKALWENGGIFTKALITGLRGEADYNHDGIIQFQELSMFIKEHVIPDALARGQIQQPEAYQLDRFGRGNILFINQPRQE